MRTVLSVAGVIFSTLFLAGCDVEDFGSSERYKEEFHYTLKGADRLSVENSNGEIEIAGWDEPGIEVTGTRYASTQDMLDSVKVEIHESSGVAEIRTVHPTTFHGNQGARYFIRAPKNTVVDRIVSSNGAVRVHDMTSSARVHTSNGAIRLENVTGGADAETSNGAIELDSVGGRLNLHTSNGRIRAEEISGACEAETSNGPVTLRFRNGPDGPTRVHTSNGAVEVSMAKSPKNGVRVETSNGSIALELPGDVSARVNAETSGSSISSDFDVPSVDREKHHLEGNIGAGGPLIELSTHNGGIHLRKGLAGAN